jgi:DNA-binding beta-propeller fold protein YncE
VLAWYLINRKPLNELPILGNEAMPTYQYSIYGVDKPLGVAVSPDGDKVYVTQSAGKRTVLEFDHSGKLLNTFETPKNVNVGLPAYVAVNPTDGSVYVSDQLAKAVLAFDADGHFQRIVKPVGLTGTWSPLGLAFDHSGDLYVTEVGGKTHRVVVLDQFGKVLRTMAPVDVALSFPNGIAVDASGNVFVADSNNGRLIAFDADGKAIGGANRGIGEGDLGLPRGVAVDSNGRVYVVDTTNQTIHGYKLTSDGANRISFVGAFGDEGIADGLFEYPNGIATDSRSNVYVTDRENGRVQVWN